MKPISFKVESSLSWFKEVKKVSCFIKLYFQHLFQKQRNSNASVTNVLKTKKSDTAQGWLHDNLRLYKQYPVC